MYVKSIPRNGAEWPCHKDPNTGDAVPTVGKRNDKFEGWEAEVICGPNTQAKNLVLKHDNAVALKLTEIRVAGLQSSKYSCDLGWKPGTQTCSRCPPGSFACLPFCRAQISVFRRCEIGMMIYFWSFVIEDLKLF